MLGCFLHFSSQGPVIVGTGRRDLVYTSMKSPTCDDGRHLVTSPGPGTSPDGHATFTTDSPVELVPASPTSSCHPRSSAAAAGASSGCVVHTVALTFPQAKAKLTIRQKGGFVRSQPGSYFDGI